MFRSQELRPGPKFKLEARGKIYKLILLNVMKDEEGEYTFSAGDKTSKANLTVSGGAISKPLKDQTVAESQQAIFECEVANAYAEGTWLKDGKSINFTNMIRSEEDGVKRRLIFEVTKSEDSAEYSYQIATSKTSAQLKVEGQY
uniref:Immunoglobulin I-set domain-containing protein n=1 Tax=Callorhinchus milii TaxID=7868 RepID=A0A4W3JKC7_CALMI